jgi:hypothetical protein
MVRIGTFPYYRVFQFHIVKPTLRIAACASQPEELDTLSRLIARWRSQKLAELQFISIAASHSLSYASPLYTDRFSDSAPSLLPRL